ncbi:MAG TPA: KH domain-containing protein [Bacillota bacterium]|nr:KH domain-containing protein [Bacillota bacterium]
MNEPVPTAARALLVLLLSNLVDHPDAVRVLEQERSGAVIFRVSVHPDDVGKVVGRGGRIVKAIRNLVRAAASQEGRRAMVEVGTP